MVGKLYGVSIGPGDPELLTLKAVRIIKDSPVIATPQTAGEKTLAYDIVQSVVDMSQKEIMKLEFLMTRNHGLLVERHQLIASQIAEQLDQGKDVAMLNLGDVSVFSTFSYMMNILTEKGYEVEVVPGVTSFCAVAATLKTSLTTMHKPLHIIPAGSLESVLELEGTKVVMKTGKAMPEIKAMLKERGQDHHVMAVQNCGLPNEVVCKTVDEIWDDASYFTTMIIKEK